MAVKLRCHHGIKLQITGMIFGLIANHHPFKITPVIIIFRCTFHKFVHKSNYELGKKAYVFTTKYFRLVGRKTIYSIIRRVTDSRKK